MTGRVPHVDLREEAVSLTPQPQPDLVLMDVRLPGIYAPEATRRIRAERPATRIILMSTYEPADLPADLDQYPDAAWPTQIADALRALIHQANLPGAGAVAGGGGQADQHTVADDQCGAERFLRKQDIDAAAPLA